MRSKPPHGIERDHLIRQAARNRSRIGSYSIIRGRLSRSEGICTRQGYPYRDTSR
jgi:hypothetical protein